MNTLILQGSPRANGNTAVLVSQFVRGLKESGVDRCHEHVLSEMELKPCRGCFSCLPTLEPACVIQDDMSRIYREYLDSDIWVFATPVYWWHMTGQMKMCLDRMMALIASPEDTTNFEGKHMVLIITYGVESPHGVELVIRLFQDIARWAKMSFDLIRYRSRDVPAINNEALLQEVFNKGMLTGRSRQSLQSPYPEKSPVTE